MAVQATNDARGDGDDQPVRAVEDARGVTWFVYPVIESSKIGAPQRTSWLCLESGKDRRFIAPIPDGWRQWPEAVLLKAIGAARPDLRDE